MWLGQVRPGVYEQMRYLCERLSGGCPLKQQFLLLDYLLVLSTYLVVVITAPVTNHGNTKIQLGTFQT